MIKVKGGVTENDKRLGKALGLAGNNMARQLGMPSAMPQKQAAPIKIQPTIKAKTFSRPDEDEAEPEVKEDRASDYDSDLDGDDDEIMAKLRAQRMAELKANCAAKTELKQKGHGLYSEIREEEFLKTVTESNFAVVHFYHKDFPRCKIIDQHLSVIAKKHPEARFVNTDAEKAPFFVNKLALIMLPTIVLFRDGIAIDRVVGFEELGGRDDFRTRLLEKRLAQDGIIKIEKTEEDEAEEEEQKARLFNPIREAMRV